MAVIHEQIHQNQTHHFQLKKLIICTIFTLIPFSFLHYYLLPLLSTQTYPTKLKTAVTTPPKATTPPKGKEIKVSKPVICDYSDGQWVPTANRPLYNGTSCGTIKEAQNCMVHGRPDTGYLYWRWQPKGESCHLPNFDPVLFLIFIEDKHLAFVGDSLARNQLESLMCLLSTASQPDLIRFQDGDDEKKFRRWIFREYNATISIYWSPYLVQSIEKAETNGVRHHSLHLDTVDEKWFSELDKIDTVIFSTGHWFFHRILYFEKNEPIGCSFLQDLNCTDLNLFIAFKKVIHTTLNEVQKRFYASNKHVVLATFTAGHFVGSWDKFGACNRTEPYKENEVEMSFGEKEMRNSELEAVEQAVKDVKNMNGMLNIEALDITKLTLLRPDGHPGPYMNANPFKDGMKERVQNDCIHWCMPGPIDTFNVILLEKMKRWREE
ncbi:hypothetical protein LUZ60_009271 [Juncus effusus]|nr:hypothetical protein LUZ60_009271 [Juncus effusus]